MLLKELAVLYSYDNKSCVHAKYIIIKIKLMLWKENIQDQIISLWANKNFIDLLTKDLPSSAFREPQSIWVYGKVYDLWILRA
jgi:hypothetical protein